MIYEGQPATNIFLYDAEGNLLENVRLVDDLGRPQNSSAEDFVTPVVVELNNENQLITGYLRPSRGEDGPKRWQAGPWNHLLRICFNQLGANGNRIWSKAQTEPC